MTKQDTGFDAFFKAITESKEFQAAVTENWKTENKNEIQKSLQSMENDIQKASDIMDSLNATFATDEAKKAGNAVGTESEKMPPKTGNSNDENKNFSVTVEHFEKKVGKPFGFEAVAGMDSLKKELQESFIKPLKFKFLVENLQKNVNSSTNTE